MLLHSVRGGKPHAPFAFNPVRHWRSLRFGVSCRIGHSATFAGYGHKENRLDRRSGSRRRLVGRFDVLHQSCEDEGSSSECEQEHCRETLPCAELGFAAGQLWGDGVDKSSWCLHSFPAV